MQAVKKLNCIAVSHPRNEIAYYALSLIWFSEIRVKVFTIIGH